MSGGFLGVDVFFVISGYLITGIILRGLQDRTFSLLKFYEKRARRLMPVLFLVLTTVLSFALFYFIPHRLIELAKSTLSTLAFSSNIYFFSKSGYFDVLNIEKPLLHTWSLAIEEQFYFVLPPVIFVGWNYFRKNILLLFIAIFVLSLGVAQYTSLRFPDFAFFLLPSRMWELMAGGILAKMELNLGGRKFHHKLAWIMPMIGIGLVLFSFVMMDSNIQHPSVISMIPISGTCLLIWFARSGDMITSFLKSKMMVKIGLISYSLYLWHFPIFSFFKILNPKQSSFEKVCEIGLAFVLAFGTYHLLEQPLRDPNRVRRGIFFKGLMVVFLGLTTLSGAIIYLKGIPQRYGVEDQELIRFNKNEHDEHLRNLFNQAKLKDFSEDRSRLKLLIIGDSFGMDLANSLNDVGLLNRVDLSTYLIVAECGNLFIEKNLDDFIEPKFKGTCKENEGYRNKKLRELIQKADVIWLASSWLDFVAPLLPESIKNIKNMTKAEILVLGRKDFGEVFPESFLRISANERPHIRNNNTEIHTRVNRYMEANMDRDSFISVHEIFCGEEYSCPAFDENGRLISYDGSHLTRAGGQILGNALLKNPSVKRAFRLDE